MKKPVHIENYVAIRAGILDRYGAQKGAFRCPARNAEEQEQNQLRGTYRIHKMGFVYMLRPVQPETPKSR